MRIYKKILSLAILVQLCSLSLTAQTSQRLSNYLDSALYNAKLLHQNQNFTTLEIFTGAMYEGYSKNIEGTPYFYSSDWFPTNIKFRGVQYYEILAKYDMHVKTLIVLHPNNITGIQLENEGIESFEISKYRFQHFKQDDVVNLDPGIYRMIEEGKYSVVLNESVRIDERITQTIERSFLKENYFFVIKDNEAYYINSKKFFLKLIGLENKKFNQLKRENKYSWKKNREELIKLSAQFVNNN